MTDTRAADRFAEVLGDSRGTQDGCTPSGPLSMTVMYGKTARVGDRAHHYGQRFPEAAARGTATITGFADGKVLLRYDDPESGYANPAGWDEDRTVLVEPLDYD